jgi:hypothetical protein
MFIVAFVSNGGNGRQAAIEAGYSENAAEQQASRLLRYAKVAAEIAKRRGRLIAKHEINASTLVVAMASVAYADPRRLVDSSGKLKPLHELDDGMAAAVASVKVRRVASAKEGETESVIEYKLSDRNAGQTNLARALGVVRDGRPLYPGGVSDPQERESLREAIAYLSPEQQIQLEAICESAIAAAETRAKAPMLEHRTTEDEEPG